ncbi:multicopper oxidase-domain-containing protein [Xylariales sp. PMI_506]|nr:multicopper oxidase-domain-containing protein [Xylariales sp. PMI_506]
MPGALLWSASKETSTASAAAKERSTVGIALHPEDHAFRDPQAITLNWTVSSGIRAPDGVKKRLYLVNGGFPGPTVEVRPGDELIIDVRNSLSDEGVSIHWHGVLVPNAMDGASGFTQCPISPGENFVYRFKIADQPGTYWWHAHVQSQRGDGLYGGFVIHEPMNRTSFVEEKEGTDSGAAAVAAAAAADAVSDVLLLVGDWFHRSADEMLAWYTSPRAFGNEPVPDSLVINGAGRFDCAKAVPARPVQCAGTAEADWGVILPNSTAPVTRLRLVNVGTIAGLTVSVTGATLRAVAVDGGSPVAAEPAEAVGIIYPGERTDVLLQWTQSEEVIDPMLHIRLDPENFKYPNPALVAEQSFPMGTRGPSSEVRTTTSNTTPSTPLVDLTALQAPTDLTDTWPAQADHTIVFYVKTQKLARYSNQPKGFINHTSWAPQTPPLLSLAREDWDGNQMVPYVPLPSPSSTSSSGSSPGVWVDLVINNLDDGSHPFHLHGHPFHVLSRYRADRLGGWGSWNPHAEIRPPGPGPNLATPVLRDTVSVPRRGHAVLRFRAEREGLWMLHCHMLVHLGSGMAAGIHVGPEGDAAHVLGRDESAGALCPPERDLPRWLVDWKNLFS